MSEECQAEIARMREDRDRAIVELDQIKKKSLETVMRKLLIT